MPEKEKKYSKGESEVEIARATGAGRIVIKRVLDQLEQDGTIKFVRGLDSRTLLISWEDIQKVIDYIKENSG